MRLAAQGAHRRAATHSGPRRRRTWTGWQHTLRVAVWPASGARRGAARRAPPSRATPSALRRTTGCIEITRRKDKAAKASLLLFANPLFRRRVPNVGQISTKAKQLFDPRILRLPVEGTGGRNRTCSLKRRGEKEKATHISGMLGGLRAVLAACLALALCAGADAGERAAPSSCARGGGVRGGGALPAAVLRLSWASPSPSVAMLPRVPPQCPAPLRAPCCCCARCLTGTVLWASLRARARFPVCATGSAAAALAPRCADAAPLVQRRRPRPLPSCKSASGFPSC